MDKICWVLWLSERWAVLRNIICINKSPPGTGPHQSGLTPDLANKGMMQTWSLTAFLEHQFKCDHAVISMRYLHSAIISLCIIGSSSQRSQRQHGAMEQGCNESHQTPGSVQQHQHCSKLSIDRLTDMALSLSRLWSSDILTEAAPVTRGPGQTAWLLESRVGLHQSEASIQVTWSAGTNQRPVSDWHSLSRGLKGIPRSHSPQLLLPSENSIFNPLYHFHIFFVFFLSIEVYYSIMRPFPARLWQVPSKIFNNK